MSEVGHPVLDFGLPYRSLLRILPRRLPIGMLGRLGAPLAPLLSRLLNQSIAALGWHPGNADDALLRSLMLTAIDDIPSSLLDEFAEWYDARTMTDRYGGFVFTEHLERITRPILIIAGSHDGLTPSRDLQNVFDRIASTDKEFRVVGKQSGFAHDYSHADLVLGLHAPTDVYPMVRDWLDSHGGVARRPASPSAQRPSRSARSARRQPAARRARAQ
jgi:pimeloyl-ACP methyl ester carboxylesterase